MSSLLATSGGIADTHAPLVDTTLGSLVDSFGLFSSLASPLHFDPSFSFSVSPSSLCNFCPHAKKSNLRKFEVEHLWGDQFERYKDSFESKLEFERQRNKIGGLVLLPNGVNQSLNDAPFEEKVDIYYGQNLLAKTLNERCYQQNPAFIQYMRQTGIPFRGYSEFKKADFDDRAEIYRRICEDIWNISAFDNLINT